MKTGNTNCKVVPISFIGVLVHFKEMFMVPQVYDAMHYKQAKERALHCKFTWECLYKCEVVYYL